MTALMLLFAYLIVGLVLGAATMRLWKDDAAILLALALVFIWPLAIPFVAVGAFLLWVGEWGD